MSSYFNLFLCSFVILQCFRIDSVNGECCKAAKLGRCGDVYQEFHDNMCADCQPGNPHCGVGKCNEDGCECEGGCRPGQCKPWRECGCCELHPDLLFVPAYNLTEHELASFSTSTWRPTLKPRQKRKVSNAENEDNQFIQRNFVDVIIQKIDLDGDRQLSQEEIYYYNTELRKIKLSNDTFDEGFKAMDLDRNGFVTYSEIELYTEGKPTKKIEKPQKNSGRELLRVADKDGNGVLSMTEAFEYFFSHGRISLTRAAIEAEIKSLDRNHDGVLSESELDPKNSSII